MKEVICPYCNRKAQLVGGDKIYPNNKSLHKKWFWRCDPCKARVGCHKYTKEPLGRLADTKLRYWKTQAHHHFDIIWSSGEMKRGEAYKWLASKLKIDENECHIGMFDVKMCKEAVKVCEEFWENKT